HAYKTDRKRFDAYNDGETYMGKIARDIANGTIKEAEGNIYQVDIPGDSELLDWDKPLSEQPAGVREKLEVAHFGGDEVIAAWRRNGAWSMISGQVLYRHLAKGL